MSPATSRIPSTCCPPATSILPSIATVSGWHELQSGFCGCGAGGGKPWQLVQRRVARRDLRPDRRRRDAARVERRAVAVGRAARRRAVQLGVVPCEASPSNGSGIAPFTCVRSETGAWQSLHVERLADRAVHDVLLVRADRALGGERLAARAERRRGVHALGAVAGGAAAAGDLHGAVDVLAAGDVDRAGREHRALVAAVAVRVLRVRQRRRRAVAGAAGRRPGRHGRPGRRGRRAAGAERRAVAVGRGAGRPGPARGRALRRERRVNGSGIAPFTCVRSETGAWQSLHANALRIVAVDDVLLVRADRALRGQRLAARADRRRRVHALGAVAGGAAAAVHLHRAVDVLAAGEVDRRRPRAPCPSGSGCSRCSAGAAAAAARRGRSRRPPAARPTRPSSVGAVSSRPRRASRRGSRSSCRSSPVQTRGRAAATRARSNGSGIAPFTCVRSRHRRVAVAARERAADASPVTTCFWCAPTARSRGERLAARADRRRRVHALGAVAGGAAAAGHLRRCRRCAGRRRRRSRRSRAPCPGGSGCSPRSAGAAAAAARRGRCRRPSGPATRPSRSARASSRRRRASRRGSRSSAGRAVSRPGVAPLRREPGRTAAGSRRSTWSSRSGTGAWQSLHANALADACPSTTCFWCAPTARCVVERLAARADRRRRVHALGAVAGGAAAAVHLRPCRRCAGRPRGRCAAREHRARVAAAAVGVLRVRQRRRRAVAGAAARRARRHGRPGRRRCRAARRRASRRGSRSRRRSRRSTPASSPLDASPGTAARSSPFDVREVRDGARGSRRRRTPLRIAAGRRRASGARRPRAAWSSVSPLRAEPAAPGSRPRCRGRRCSRRRPPGRCRRCAGRARRRSPPRREHRARVAVAAVRVLRVRQRRRRAVAGAAGRRCRRTRPSRSARGSSRRRRASRRGSRSRRRCVAVPARASCPARRGPRTAAGSSPFDVRRGPRPARGSRRTRTRSRIGPSTTCFWCAPTARCGGRASRRCVPSGRRRVHALGAVAGGAAASRRPATVPSMCWPPATSIAPLARTVPAWQRSQSVFCGCGSGGGAPWQEPQAVGPGRHGRPRRRGGRAARRRASRRGSRSSAGRRRFQLGVVPPATRAPVNGSEIVAVHVREVRDRRVAVAARERVADAPVHDVLLVRADRALRWSASRRACPPAAPGSRPRCRGTRCSRRRPPGRVPSMCWPPATSIAPRRRARCPSGSGCSRCSAGAATAAARRGRSRRPPARPTPPSRSAPSSRRPRRASRRGSRSSCTSSPVQLGVVPLRREAR